MVQGDLFEPVLPDPVQAAVPHVGDRDPVVEVEAGHDRRAHPLALGLRFGGRIDDLVGLHDGIAQQEGLGREAGAATMPDDIEALARKFMKNPERVEVTPPSTTVEKIEQMVYFVDQSLKRDLVLHLLDDKNVKRALIFTRTKHGADRAVKELVRAKVAAAAIHGNKSQSARENALEGFKRGSVRVLVATDIAARGIDVDDITHVIQMDLPEVPEQYVHRIGRTARAGASGIAWAMCSDDERPLLRDIEREIRMRVDVVGDHPFVGKMGTTPPKPKRPQRGGRNTGRSGDRERGEQRRIEERQMGIEPKGKRRQGNSGRPAPSAQTEGAAPERSGENKARPVVRSFRPSTRRR